MNIAVYGTLRKNNGNHVLLQDCEMIKEGWVEGYNMLSNGGFPAVWKGDRRVYVEIYDVDAETLRGVDNLEGYPSWYGAEWIEVDGIKARMYVMSPDQFSGHIEIKEGNWNERHTERNSQA